VLRATDAHGRRCLAMDLDLDLAGAAGIRGLLLAELAAGRPVTLDLTRVGFIASVGAGLLLEGCEIAEDLQASYPPARPAPAGPHRGSPPSCAVGRVPVSLMPRCWG
jgi:hypothetical protein